MYYLVNPDTGSAYDVVVSFDGNFYKCFGGSISLTGVDQTNPIDDLTGPPYGEGVAGGSGDPSLDVTTLTDGAWVIDTLARRNYDDSTTVGSGQTERWNLSNSDTLDAGLKGTALIE